MEEFIYYNNLFDFYSDLLTEKEQNTFKDYYQENLSLSEIADLNNVSRSAIQKTLKTVLEKLNNYEDKIHAYHINQQLKEILQVDDINIIKQRITELLEK